MGTDGVGGCFLAQVIPRSGGFSTYSTGRHMGTVRAITGKYVIMRIVLTMRPKILPLEYNASECRELKARIGTSGAVERI
jgi:hypothetical protein